MVFGKLFGWGKKDDGGESTAPPKVPAGWLSTLDPAWRQVLREIDKHPDLVPTKPLIVNALRKRDLEEARRFLQTIVLPRLSAAEAERLKHAGAHEAWATYTDLKAAGIIQDASKLPKDELGIGWYGTGPDDYATLHFTGEGHLLTVAPTGEALGWPKTMEHWPLLFILDELPQLGYMEIIENAIAIARGYNIRLWLFVQDMAQLQEVYPKARSIAANCRCKMYFRINDTETATEVSERLGRRKDIWGGEDWVAAPARLMSTEYRDDAIIFMDGLNIRSMMPPIVAADPDWTAWIAHEKKVWGEEVRRQPPPEPHDDGDSDAAPDDRMPEQGTSSSHAMAAATADADLADNPEYQAKLAALQAEMRARRDAPAAAAATMADEGSARPPERPSGSSDTPKRGPVPPGFDD